MKNERPMPLMMIDHVTNVLGHSIWDKIEKYRAAHSHEWDDRCYIPMTDLSMNILYPDYPIEVSQRTPYPMVAALAAWRRCKEIYRFDPDFAALLTEDADINAKIPYDALAQLPFNCLYIDTPLMDFDGFFVFFEYDMGVMELRMDGVRKSMIDGTMVVSLNMVGETLADGIEESLRHARTALRKQSALYGKDSVEIAIREFEQMSKTFIPCALQLVLYLCAENAEIKENAAQKAITRRGTVIHDQFREIRAWDVGTEAGIRIRRYHASKGDGTQSSKHSGHASPSPHMRRAHWHHFWTGKRNSEDRTLVLRWIPPTFVAGDGNTEAPITTINEL